MALKSFSRPGAYPSQGYIENLSNRHTFLRWCAKRRSASAHHQCDRKPLQPDLQPRQAHRRRGRIAPVNWLTVCFYKIFKPNCGAQWKTLRKLVKIGCAPLKHLQWLQPSRKSNNVNFKFKSIAESCSRSCARRITCRIRRSGQRQLNDINRPKCTVMPDLIRHPKALDSASAGMTT